MNAGLASLHLLKTFLLAPALVADTDYNAPLLAIGRGVAAQFDQYTNRRLARVAGDTCVFTADRAHYFLPRSPVEAVTKIECQEDPDTGYIEQALTGFFTAQNLPSGFIAWATELGEWHQLVRVTYTGGYWFDETDDDTGTPPATATLIPGDLQLAWLLQCQHVWQQRDKLGVSLSEEPEASAPLATLDLLPQVRTALRPYLRATLT